MASAPEQAPLWEPTAGDRERAEMTRFMRFAGERRGRAFADYDELWRWSVAEVEEFWASIWEFCGVRASKPYECVLDRSRGTCAFGANPRFGQHEMPGTHWFVGAELNYAENLLLGPLTPRSGAVRDPDEPAVLHCSELRELEQLTRGELTAEVARAAGGLRALGVQRGDCVVAYMPNIPETLIAFLAVASIGAIWSSAAPEFGARSVIDRFAQIEPKVLFAVDGSRHGGKDFDRGAAVKSILEEMGSVEHVVAVPYLHAGDAPAAAVQTPAPVVACTTEVLGWEPCHLDASHSARPWAGSSSATAPRSCSAGSRATASTTPPRCSAASGCARRKLTRSLRGPQRPAAARRSCSGPSHHWPAPP